MLAPPGKYDETVLLFTGAVGADAQRGTAGQGVVIVGDWLVHQQHIQQSQHRHQTAQAGKTNCRE